MQHFNIIQQICIWALPVLFAITLHEVAHGWVAKQCGDNSAWMLGRLSLNPIKHIDPLGTIVVPILLLFLGGFVFGWAKPVPVNYNALNKPKRDMALVALAGPVSNLLMALFWAMVMKLGILAQTQHATFAVALIYMGQAGIMINLVLCLLNLIPIPPLDGSRVVSSLLPSRYAYTYSKIEPYGFFILLALIATKLLSIIIYPPMAFLYTAILRLFGIM